MAPIPALYDHAVDIAHAALAGVIAEYQAANIAPPSVSYVSTGDVAHDGEQLTVSVVRMFGVDPDGGFPSEGTGPLMCTWWRGVEVAVTHLRCAPTGKVVAGNVLTPEVTEHQKSAEQVLRDAIVCTRGLVRAYRDGSFGEGYSFTLSDWTAISAEGGLIGGLARARVGLSLV